MPILTLLVYFALIGLIAWALIRFVPMPSGIQTVITVAAVLFCVLILLQAMGVTILSGPTVPRIR